MSLVIRPARATDGPDLARVYAPFVDDVPASFEERAPTAAEMSARVDAGWARAPWLVAERDGGFAGYAYASLHRERAAYRWTCETSVFVAPAHHRAGAGRALYQRLFALLRLQGFVRAYALIALPNEASVALHEALGFVRAAVLEEAGFKHGAWRDVGWWSLALATPTPVPPPARKTPAELANDPDWRHLLDT